MKNKVFIGIIIVLLVLLWGQMFFYNNYGKSSSKQANSSNRGNVVSQTKREVANATTEIETINDNYDLLYNSYKGPVGKEELNNYIKDLLDNKKFTTLYNNLKNKSKDSMNQYYDTHNSEMESYNIYTFEDAYNIYDQLNHVLWVKSPICVSRNIDMTSIESTDEYTSFKVIFKFHNNNEMTLKISLGNSESAEHRIMLSA